MMTIDEVIERLEGIFGYISDSTKNDVLYYLKMYRSDMQMYAENQKYWEDELRQKIKDFVDAKERYIKRLKDLDIGTNNPLTWDELKTLKGKPVWVEHLKDGVVYKAGWCLIVQVDDSLPDIPCVGIVDTDADYRNLEVEWMDMGQWQAYRKERYEPDQKAN